ncbi:DUF4365 domain-containing protein [Actinomadura sp. BRA 177]|uniref:DUF4365 domain-containing protein n=1 Tax=Actinomadura sp. BRA 177 TaxID=2745202 RepID=UPI0015962764|nr:DUF4365 domain-containing protein [Actinomadura sp. BRA 177]NVI90589.1 DUF4365 domain-containing protein [Actinomadura sp. BRA 177]
MRDQDQNTLQGDFGEAWLEAVAAGCGLLHGRPTTVDLQKADVQLVYPGTELGTYYPTVNVQVKTTIELRQLTSGDFRYDLDLETYDALRRIDHAVGRVLAVIGVFGEGENVRLHSEGTLLCGRGSWISLEGMEPSRNGTSQAIHLPLANTLDRPGLHRMLKTHGVRRSTPVPPIDAWGRP